ncbi:Hypothetical_protein [Hexamita inflata]|uniref:Hypothetical_protein n=1 Tax=Hexamita inflata TaxID=28002 RepID=A0AA86RAB2_9EUKA|nr:Hypothetical protein HINF_LOCUS56768 [Hexamita inflata]
MLDQVVEAKDIIRKPAARFQASGFPGVIAGPAPAQGPRTGGQVRRAGAADGGSRAGELRERRETLPEAEARRAVRLPAGSRQAAGGERGARPAGGVHPETARGPELRDEGLSVQRAEGQVDAHHGPAGGHRQARAPAEEGAEGAGAPAADGRPDQLPGVQGARVADEPAALPLSMRLRRVPKVLQDGPWLLPDLQDGDRRVRRRRRSPTETCGPAAELHRAHPEDLLRRRRHRDHDHAGGERVDVTLDLM